MSETELQFRTAAFGGFQKQDVLNYIEASNQEHREKLEELNGELEQLRQSCAQLEAEKAQAQQAAGEGEQSLHQLEEELAAARQEGEQVREKLGQAERELEELRERLAQTESRLAQSEPAAQAYQKVKDRTAGIELEAHCRAQAVQAEAEERVEKTRQDLEAWLGKVRRGYEELRSDMNTAISHTCGELERMRAALDGIGQRFALQDERLGKMVQSCVGEHRPPDPLPLEEKK